MLSSLIIENFKSYVKAVIPLASMTFLIGPNASGKSNALEAFRLLSWLAKGMRLDDIGRNIQNGDAHIRGRAADLFKDVTDVLTIGCHLDDSVLGWNELQIEIGMSDEQLVLEGEAISSSSEALPLYHVEGLQLNAVKTSPVFHCAKRNPCSNTTFPRAVAQYFFSRPQSGSHAGLLLCRR